jgi:hypothetical protein
MTLRVLDFWPVPQVLEHSENAVQPEIWQSTGQACALHCCVLEAAAQLLPPCWAATTTERVEVWEPEPQEREQMLNSDQSDCTQSIGQATVLQVWDSVKVGHT